MTEWLLILLVVYGGGGSAQVTMERFATEADCQRAQEAAKVLATPVGPPMVGLGMDGTCVEVGKR